MEDCFLAKATERIFLPLLQQTLPEIRDINFPLEGVFHDCVMVSIKKHIHNKLKSNACYLGYGTNDVHQNDYCS